MFGNLPENDIDRRLASGSTNRTQVVRVKFKPIEPVSTAKAKARSIEVLGDVNVSIDVQLGTTKLTVRDILDLDEGTVIELSRVAGDPVDVYINEQEFATGEIVVINETYGVRINNLVSGEMDKEE